MKAIKRAWRGMRYNLTEAAYLSGLFADRIAARQADDVEAAKIALATNNAPFMAYAI